jgi:redox-sensitive bicupin YhaK (pirin superfamily)
MVGPFIFFDHMGPATFAPGQGMDVRPHPHINLATVTYLFDGKILHRDSLGSRQIIEPGAVNWMTAGHGIVHSERSPDDFRASGGRMNGIQCWVALPVEHEETKPSFTHHPAASLPEFHVDGVKLKLLLGSSFGRVSPVPIHSDMFYLDARFSKDSSMTIPASAREAAVYVVEGEIEVEGEIVSTQEMAVCSPGGDVRIHARVGSRVMLLGGEPLKGDRHIFWNFVSSSKEKLETAKSEWQPGPGSKRFPTIPDDDREFIPLPEEPKRGTAL